MHLRGHIELAGILASHGPLLIERGQSLPAESVEQYWVTSKVRLDRWAWRLKQFSDPQAVPTKRPRRSASPAKGVLEEVLVSEMLTRVWTAILCAHDRRRGSNEVEPIARSVMLGHVETRHRALISLVHGLGIDTATAVQLNSLRYRIERWTDLLIGHLTQHFDASEFAIEPDRAKDFAEDLRQRGSLAGGRHAWSLVFASLRAAFRTGLATTHPNTDLNARIANSILSCFPPEVFGETGLFRSLWLMRLAQVADETHGMITDLLEGTTADHSESSEASWDIGRAQFLRRNRPR